MPIWIPIWSQCKACEVCVANMNPMWYQCKASTKSINNLQSLQSLQSQCDAHVNSNVKPMECQWEANAGQMRSHCKANTKSIVSLRSQCEANEKPMQSLRRLCSQCEASVIQKWSQYEVKEYSLKPVRISGSLRSLRSLQKQCYYCVKFETC